MLRLAGAQRRRRLGAVEDEVGGKIFANLGGDLPARRGDPVDDGIGKPGARHLGRVDVLALGLPFFGNRAGEFRRRCRERPAGRRARRLAIKLHGISTLTLPIFACGNCYRLIEAAPAHRPHGAAHRLDRIVGLVTFKQFPHRKNSSHVSKGLGGWSCPLRAAPAAMPSQGHNRAVVKDRRQQNLVIPSTNHRNPQPSRLVSAAGFGDRTPKD